MEPPSAWVEIDGARLFRVRGVDAFPADKRSSAIETRIEAFARDAAFRPESIKVRETEIGTAIVAGDKPVLTVVPPPVASPVQGVLDQVQATGRTVDETLEGLRLG